MKREFQHVAIALALAGVALLVPYAAAASQSQASIARQEHAQMHREVRQDKRQIHKVRGNVRVSQRQLKKARRQYATGKSPKGTMRSNIRQAKQAAKAARSQATQQFHLHRRQVSQKPKKK